MYFYIYIYTKGSWHLNSREKESFLGLGLTIFSLLEDSRDTDGKIRGVSGKGWLRISQPNNMDASHSMGDFTLGFCTSMMGCAKVRMQRGDAGLGGEECNTGGTSSPCTSPLRTPFLLSFFNTFFHSLAE